MGSRLNKLSFLRAFCTLRSILVLWFLIATSVSVYVMMMQFWPIHKAYQYYISLHHHLDNPERGSLRFFVERQRRTIFELSRSVYMQHLLSFVGDSSEVTEQRRLKMESFIKAYQKYFGYKQIFLLDSNGAFIFTTLADLRGKNINDPAFKGSLIIDSFNLAKMTLTSDITPTLFDPVVQQKAFFIIMPVFFAHELKGFLVVQIDDKQIESILMKHINLGRTGNFLITQCIKDRITYILPPAGDDPNLIFPVRPEINRKNGTPTERSALGYEGYGILHDYRGVQVVAAWYFMPQLNWGFVYKIDYTEIIRPIRWFGFGIILLFLCTLVCTIRYIIDLMRNKTISKRKPMK